MTTSPSARFGAFLKSFRTAAGLTQEALAERAGVSTRGVQDLERGIHQTPRRDTVELLAAALGLRGRDHAEFMAAAQGQLLPPPPAHPLASAASLGFSSSAPLPLVGRERELALLHGFLAGADAREGATRLLLLAGEPGIGKTRLLQAVAQQAIATGWSVLVGGCQRRGEQEPYAPLVDALSKRLHLQRPERHAADLTGCAWLARLLPELADVTEPLPTIAPAQERRLMYAAVARFLANVAGPAGTLLVLDDLQWAGSDALDLLTTLARAAAPLCIVGAYRDTEVRPEDPLSMLLADLAQARLVHRLALGPLAAEDAATLLADLLAGAGGAATGDRTVDVEEAVLQRAAGVPFFLISYAQALAAGAAEAIPWDLAQGVRQRVTMLPEPARQLLAAASVVGRRVSRALLVALAGPAEDAVLDGLEAACQAGLLLEEGDDDYLFAHDVIREVVEADVGSARRAALHRHVAAALESDAVAASADLLAYHCARGGLREKAVYYLELAGDQAWSQRAPGAAEGYFREALDRLDGLGRTYDAVRVREKLAGVLYQTGRYETAIAVLEPVVEVYRVAEDQEGLGRVVAQVGWAHARRGRPVEGLALIQPLLERLEGEDGGNSSSLAALYTLLGQLLFATGQYDAALAACERAATVARAGGHDRIHAQAAGLSMFLLEKLSRLGDALCVGQEMLPLVEAVGDPDSLLRAHRDLADIHLIRGDVATSLWHTARARAVAEQMGDPAQLAHTLAQVGWIASVSGDLLAARSAIDEAMVQRRQVEQSWYMPYPLIDWARVSLAAGDRAVATTAIAEALASAQGTGDLQALRWAASVMAELDVLEGRPEEAGARLIPLLDRPGLEECDVTSLLPVLAWAYLEQGQADQATDTIQQALTRARREEMRFVLVEALRVEALIALRRVGWDEAARSLEEGLVLSRAMPYPYAEARLLLVYGELHAQRREPAAARERLEAAQVLLARLGARMDAERVERALEALSRNDGPGG